MTETAPLSCNRHIPSLNKCSCSISYISGSSWNGPKSLYTGTPMSTFHFPPNTLCCSIKLHNFFCLASIFWPCWTMHLANLLPSTHMSSTSVPSQVHTGAMPCLMAATTLHAINVVTSEIWGAILTVPAKTPACSFTEQMQALWSASPWAVVDGLPFFATSFLWADCLEGTAILQHLGLDSTYKKKERKKKRLVM